MTKQNLKVRCLWFFSYPEEEPYCELTARLQQFQGNVSGSISFLKINQTLRSYETTFCNLYIICFVLWFFSRIQCLFRGIYLNDLMILKGKEDFQASFTFNFTSRSFVLIFRNFTARYFRKNQKVFCFCWKYIGVHFSLVRVHDEKQKSQGNGSHTRSTCLWVYLTNMFLYAVALQTF